MPLAMLMFLKEEKDLINDFNFEMGKPGPAQIQAWTVDRQFGQRKQRKNKCYREI